MDRIDKQIIQGIIDINNESASGLMSFNRYLDAAFHLENDKSGKGLSTEAIRLHRAIVVLNKEAIANLHVCNVSLAKILEIDIDYLTK